MEKRILIYLALFALAACTSSGRLTASAHKVPAKYPVVTIETSGDLYFEEEGSNVQVDFFGNCAPGFTTIMIEVDKKQRSASCKKNRYRYSMNLPKTFFAGQGKNYTLKEIRAFHGGHKNLNATSYLLVDRKKREIKSVINKQVLYERIPTGEFEPITQFSAFGSCSDGANVTIDITSLDRFGHRISKYDETKTCQSSGFYFLSQVNGIVKRGTRFHVYESKTMIKPARDPASGKNSKPKPELKNLFEWTVIVK